MAFRSLFCQIDFLHMALFFQRIGKDCRNLKINERLKDVLWKFANEALGTKAILSRRIRAADSLCPRCGFFLIIRNFFFFWWVFLLFKYGLSLYMESKLFPSRIIPIQHWIRTILYPALQPVMDRRSTLCHSFMQPYFVTKYGGLETI